MYALSITKPGTGTGTVTGNPGGISCGAVCAADVPYGQLVTLTATAGSGSRFDGWGGACSGEAGTCSVTIDQARAVTATFTQVFTLRLIVSAQVSSYSCGGPFSAPRTCFNGSQATLSTDSGGFSCSVDSFASDYSVGNSCSKVVPAGVAITVTGTGAPQFSMNGNGGCVVAADACTVLMTADTTIALQSRP